MTASEFKEWFKDIECSICGWHVEIDKKSMSPFTVGCYYDDLDGYFKVYKVGERNNLHIRLKTKDEHEAYNKLKSLVEYVQWQCRGYI